LSLIAGTVVYDLRLARKQLFPEKHRTHREIRLQFFQWLLNRRMFVSSASFSVWDVEMLNEYTDLAAKLTEVYTACLTRPTS
ncbi:hypothetical protein, partial [Proteus terrae]|uniref:hypothetical protein n=1 Tax=Proteus terrae TaxID=1574161 RepID=UPI001CBBF3FC